MVVGRRAHGPASPRATCSCTWGGPGPVCACVSVRVLRCAAVLCGIFNPVLHCTARRCAALPPLPYLSSPPLHPSTSPPPKPSPSRPGPSDVSTRPSARLMSVAEPTARLWPGNRLPLSAHLRHPFDCIAHHDSCCSLNPELKSGLLLPPWRRRQARNMSNGLPH